MKASSFMGVFKFYCTQREAQGAESAFYELKKTLVRRYGNNARAEFEEFKGHLEGMGSREADGLRSHGFVRAVIAGAGVFALYLILSGGQDLVCAVPAVGVLLICFSDQTHARIARRQQALKEIIEAEW